MPPSEDSPVLYALLLDTPEASVEPVSNHLFELGASGIEERESTIGSCLVVYAPERARLLEWRSAVERRFGAIEWQLETVDPDWTRRWHEFLRPEPVTRSFVMQPVGERVRAGPADVPADALRILYEPALAFGTGGHATTRLCAREIEDICRGRGGLRVLDVGCGTGVLAFVAVLSGASSALGIDVDPRAVASATRNAELNRLSDRCRFTSEPLEAVSGRFELVVANIEIGVLAKLPARLERVVAPHGQLLLSGILPEQAGGLEQQLEGLGFDPVHARDEGEFRLLRLKRRAGR